MWWNRYDNVGVDENQQWFNWFNGNLGGMMMNHNKKIVSVFTTFVAGDENNIDTRNYLVTMDIQGQVQSQHLVDSTLANYSVNGLIEDFTDSTYVLHGWYMDSLDVINNTEPDAFLLKIDSLGNHIWQKEYPNTFGTYTASKAMDGGFWICANTPSLGECSDGFFTNNDLVLIKTDESGNEEDRIVMGGQCSNERATVFEYEEDKIILVGRLTLEEQTMSPFEGYMYTSLVEQLSDNQLTNPTDVKKYLFSGLGNFTDFLALSDGALVITGDNYVPSNWTDWSENYERSKGFILKLNQERDSLWCRTYSYYDNIPTFPEGYGFAEHYILDSKPTPDGGFVCSGWIEQQIQDPNPFLQTPWLFKVDSLGCLEPGCQDVGVSEIVIGLQNTMSLFPNPANSIANISFSFPTDYSPPKNNQLVVVDMQGREVMRENVSLFGQANIAVEMDVSKLSAGIYTVHWVSENAWMDSVKLMKE